MKCVQLESERLKKKHIKSDEKIPALQVDISETTKQKDAKHSNIMASWQKLKEEVLGNGVLSSTEMPAVSSCPTESSMEINVTEELMETENFAEAPKEVPQSGHREVQLSESQCGKDTAKQRNTLRSFTDMGRKQVFDNIDYQQVVHHMDEEHQNLLHHWTSYMSTENRVSGNHLPDCQPQGKLEDMENGKCIPNHAEHRKQRQSYIHLISRICSENITCLKPLMSSLPKHIPHVYTEQMSHPIETVRFYNF